MFFRVLGPVVAEVDGRPIKVPGARERCVLGVLLLAAPNPVPIDRLIHLLWADLAPQDARSAVHTYVSRLRRALRPVPADGERQWVTRVAAGYRIEAGPESVDLHRFTRLTDRGNRAFGIHHGFDPSTNDAAFSPVHALANYGLEVWTTT